MVEWVNRVRQRIAEDDLSHAFLRALRYYDDEATTSEIRLRTGMSASECQYRFNKLEELGLIHVRYADEGKGDRHPPRVAKLADKGRTVMHRGLVKGPDRNEDGEIVIEVSESDYFELLEAVDRLQNRLNVLVEQIE
jgi:DNA-binding Lrp family transcriptional regulator